VIGHEECVKPAAFQSLDETRQMAEVEIGVRRGTGHPPPGGVDADRTHEGAKMKLPRHVRAPVFR
jgi:hypothetical protein